MTNRRKTNQPVTKSDDSAAEHALKISPANELTQVHSIDPFSQHIKQLATAYQGQQIKADIRYKSSDFIVNELLSFEPCGSGEHLFLQIQKTDCNTQWVIRHLQKTFQLTSKDVGYAGKKDRHSVSTQWFSLHLPGKEVDAHLLENEQLKLVGFIRHNRKLRVGSIKQNQFKLILRNLSAMPEPALIDKLMTNGVPNYFGAQRFGHQAKNLALADKLFKQQINIKNREKRSMAISSGRSFLFNLILSKRVADKTWNQALDGDALNLAGSHSFFIQDKVSVKEQQRIDKGDLHICGTLLGNKASEVSQLAKSLEEQVFSLYPEWRQGLQRLAVNTQMRAFRCMPKDFSYQQKDNQAQIEFSLDSGCYATSVLRELFDISDIASERAQAAYQR
ncbi:MAG: tRNA pseudouridine(13) synthase TruD [Enterobacterales bacterium]|nr:tRNA pseudouridine(13) synthase TruD [Enterobacterales bacterium]